MDNAHKCFIAKYGLTPLSHGEIITRCSIRAEWLDEDAMDVAVAAGPDADDVYIFTVINSLPGGTEQRHGIQRVLNVDKRTLRRFCCRIRVSARR